MIARRSVREDRTATLTGGTDSGGLRAIDRLRVRRDRAKLSFAQTRYSHRTDTFFGRWKYHPSQRPRSNAVSYRKDLTVDNCCSEFYVKHFRHISDLPHRQWRVTVSALSQKWKIRSLAAVS
jgi:hypothetical protein